MKRIATLILLAGTAQADNTTVYDEDLNYRGQVYGGQVYDEDNNYRGYQSDNGDLYDGDLNYRGRVRGDRGDSSVILLNDGRSRRSR